ncbi:MAG: hypothetical protein J6I89_07045, partial [Oscillospiraceae bacterium]|nr:hypothetical protein [Oscillospiraceae bacterium]
RSLCSEFNVHASIVTASNLHQWLLPRGRSCQEIALGDFLTDVGDRRQAAQYALTTRGISGEIMICLSF